MKTLAAWLVLAGFAFSQEPQQIIALSAQPNQQQQIDLAWKDIEIANLRLQLAITQALSTMDKSAYYDFQKKAFLMPAPKPAAPSAAPSLKVVPKEKK